MTDTDRLLPDDAAELFADASPLLDDAETELWELARPCAEECERAEECELAETPSALAVTVPSSGTHLSCLPPS